MVADINSTLRQIYHDWKSGLVVGHPIATLLGPPLLLNVNEHYCRAQTRILVIGQETYGWQWTGDLKRTYAEYPEDWPFADMTSWADFVAQVGAVESLCWAYDQFAFGLRQPQTHRSPFWCAFREIGTWRGAGLMWTNLVRADYENGTILAALDHVQQWLRAEEADLLAREITALKPDVCVFFTGPNYDHLIEDKWPGCSRTAMSDLSEHQIARLEHPGLPFHSYRLYHPAYLRRSGKWHLIELLREHLVPG